MDGSRVLIQLSACHPSRFPFRPLGDVDTQISSKSTTSDKGPQEPSDTARSIIATHLVRSYSEALLYHGGPDVAKKNRRSSPAFPHTWQLHSKDETSLSLEVQQE